MSGGRKAREYAGTVEDREWFMRENSAELIRAKEDQIAILRKEVELLLKSKSGLRKVIKKLQEKTAMDLATISPAPWHAEEHEPLAHNDAYRVYAASTANNPSPWIADVGIDPLRSSNAEFIAMCRNDLDVKQRRGWHTEKNFRDNWIVPQLIEWWDNNHRTDEDEEMKEACYAASEQKGHDVGLLTKADIWFKENVMTTFEDGPAAGNHCGLFRLPESPQ